MIKYYLSWDCATKSLAYAYVSIDTSISAQIFEHYKIIMGDSYICLMSDLLTTEYDIVTAKINNIIQAADAESLKKIKDWYIKLQYIFANFIKIIELSVVDLAVGVSNKNISDNQRITLLGQYLKTLDNKFGIIDYVLIEQQPVKIGGAHKTNIYSAMVSHCICYHYLRYNPQFVCPLFKNKICFAEHLELSNVGRQNDNMYARRKLHSKLNLLYYLAQFSNMHLITGVPKKNYSDTADAFMQILGYIMYSNDQ